MLTLSMMFHFLVSFVLVDSNNWDLIKLNKLEHEGQIFDIINLNLYEFMKTNNIVEGNDTCNLQSVCIPVPQQSDDPRIIPFPLCYKVMQCVGSCCEDSRKCQPLSKSSKKIPVQLLTYIGNRNFRRKAIELTVEEHHSCSCACERKPSCSPGFIVGRSCKCECANKVDGYSCPGKSIWDAEKCKCQCNVNCKNDTHIADTQKCRCIKKPPPILDPSAIKSNKEAGRKLNNLFNLFDRVNVFRPIINFVYFKFNF